MTQLLTLSGNEITDISRSDATQWGISSSGGMADGLYGDSSLGIFRFATNLFCRGQCDATAASWGNGGVGVLGSVDASVSAPYSAQSIKYVSDGLAAFQGCLAQSSTGLAAAAGTIGVGSIYFKGTAGQSYFTQMRWVNTDASVTDGTQTIFVATGSWQLLVPSSLAVAVGKTGDQLVVMARINGTRAETFNVAHAMLESGQSVVAPYVATSGGTTATHPFSRVDAPLPLLSPVQGWMAVRLRLGWGSAVAPYGGASRDDLALFADSSGNNGIQWFWREASNDWRARIVSGAAALGDASIPDSFNAGDTRTIIIKWGVGSSGISLQGGAFVNQAVGPPVFTPGAFTIGSFLNGSQINSNVLWFACGTGIFTDADAAELAKCTSGSPRAYVGADAQMTACFPSPGIGRLVPPVALNFA